MCCNDMLSRVTSPSPLQMPRIWIEYLELILESGHVTSTRMAFDDGLRSLPITQHHRIWPLYLKVSPGSSPAR